jgi:glycosyltransferase involved in cell wall biosynthesis
VLPIPSVSVCLPVYNGERFLAETIRSVLDQTYRDFELVVLDNASTDRSGAIARSFGDPRIRIERNRETLPQAENWNRIVELARGPLVKVVCADDLLHPRCLELQVAPMDADPGLAVVAARRHMIDEQSRVIVPRRGLKGLIGVHTGVEVARRVVRSGSNPIGESNNVLFRRDDFFTVGGGRPTGRTSWTSTCGCGCCSSATSSDCPRRWRPSASRATASPRTATTSSTSSSAG